LKFSGGAPAKQAETEARAGKNSFPPTPFLFARPSEFFSKVSVRIFLEIGSDFIQERQHFDKLSVSRPAREFFSWDFVFTLAFSF